jgi:hypothetical protein
MSEIGRNDLCHCGSGKKYKKCCLETDKKTVNQTVFPTNSEIEEVFEDEEDDFFPVKPINFSSEWTDDDDTDDSDISEPERPGLPFPELSKEEDAFLDKWYQKIKSIKKPIDKLNAAAKFMEEHPELVPAWGFEGEHLLDLNPNCYKEGYTEEIYNFLISLRTQYPGVYQREFGYYDSDLIFHTYIKGKKSDIPPLLDNFEKYPDAFPEKLFEVVNNLAAIGESAILFPFLKKTHKQVIHSNKIIGGYEIITPLMLHIEGKYIQENVTDNQYVQLCNEVREVIEVNIDDKFLSPDYWKEQHAIIYSEPGIFSCSLSKKREKTEAYLRFIKQYLKYLNENAVHNWVATCMIGFELTDYINYTLEINRGKKHKYFIFDEKVLDEYISQKLKNYFWVDTCKTNALLTGIWYFTQFLVETGNTTEAEMLKIRDTCLEFHALEQKINKGYVESAIFSKFPMY